jgi:hypothetical protein
MSLVSSILRAKLALPAIVALAGALAACSTGVNQAWTAPGWYLEKPRQLLLVEPAYVAGPFSYDDCEVERLKTKTPELYLCNREIVSPSSWYNPWTPLGAASQQPSG